MIRMSPLTSSEMISDLECRFIVNLPIIELTSFDRLIYHLSEASWFYNDYLRHAYGTIYRSTRAFCHLMFTESRILQPYQLSFDRLYRSFCQYVCQIPVYGCMIISKCGKYILVVRGPTGYWSFPKGKQNQAEDGETCARREVFEETGYKYPSVPLGIGITRWFYGRRLTMYRLQIVRYDPSTTHCRQNRYEISKVEWIKISVLARKDPRWYPTIMPFVSILHTM
jgi:mRNA-decapping enzyme subunit 2